MSETVQIQPAFYWDLSDFAPFVKDELNRRIKSNSGNFTYEEGIKPDSKYTHPLAVWTRICSNTSMNGKDGFVLGGMQNSGFKQSYGFGQEVNGTVIGYTPDGKKHIIENERYKHRPSPGILSIDTELSGGEGKFRITTIKWVCWSLDQLNYMGPYFLTNGVSMSVEFGWNSIDAQSLLPLSNESALLKYYYNEDPKFSIPELVKKSQGNYDGSMGIISDFDFKVRADGGFDCMTVVKNIGGFFSGVYSTTKTSSETESPNSPVEEIKTFIKKKFNNALDLAQKVHIDRRKGAAAYSKTGKTKGNEMAATIVEEVFYKRNSLGGPHPTRTKQGKPKDYDFDKNTENWWMSFGYLVRILNSKCSVKSGDYELFKINIDDAIISAHPNIISNNGDVLLIPNTRTPQILVFNEDGVKPSPIPENSDPDIIEANKILKETQKYFNNTGTRTSISIINMNEVLNWFEPVGARAFPTISSDKNDIKGSYSGYLKNLYVSKEVIVNAVESSNTFKGLLTNILEQMSRAAGDIWNFQIVPLTPDGNSNGTMTIIDNNSVNGFSGKNIFNFEINTPKSIMKSIEFAVKSTDAVTVQTLFGGSDENGNYISQDFKSPITLKKNDRLIKKLTPAGKTDVEKEQENEELSKRKQLGNERIPTKESSKFYFYTKADNVTYMLVEPVEEIQKGLILSGTKSPLRYSCVQPGITLDITLQGISGMVNLNTFTVSELPHPYGDRCFFQVQNVKHSVHSGNWETKITAGVRLKPEFAGT